MRFNSLLWRTSSRDYIQYTEILFWLNVGHARRVKVPLPAGSKFTSPSPIYLQKVLISLSPCRIKYQGANVIIPPVPHHTGKRGLKRKKRAQALRLPQDALGNPVKYIKYIKLGRGFVCTFVCFPLSIVVAWAVGV